MGEGEDPSGDDEKEPGKPQKNPCDFPDCNGLIKKEARSYRDQDGVDRNDPSGIDG